MIRRTVRDNGGGLILAVILLLVGGCYFLRNTLGIAIGAWILYRNLSTRSGDPGS